jgi:hypothetical protein
MRYFCTYFDAKYLTRGLALHQSLTAHAGEFELVVLCMDQEAEAGLKQKALSGVRLVPVAELIRSYPALATAQTDRTPQEFQLTCKSWLLRHLLPQIPAGHLLTYLDAGLYFFSSLQPLYDEIGAASIAITPHRFPASLSHLERTGKFNPGWISLRHDATGEACAADWAAKCADWCFFLVEPTRYAEQKYLEAWPAQFPGVHQISHPGANVAPWNVADAVITGSPSGPRVNRQPLIFYHFHSLQHLVRQLYDPGLQRFSVAPTTALRELVYQPYLRVLGDSAGPETPDIVPPARTDDPRSGLALAQLAEQLRATQQLAAAHQLALEKNRAASRQALAESRDAMAGTQLYLKDVEADRAAQRLSLLKVNQELKKAYFDLEGNVTYIKGLLADTALQNAGKDAQIAGLNAELNRRSVAATQVEQENLRLVIEPYSRKIRRLLVAKFHPRLLPEILWLSLFGTAVEVLDCPPEYSAAAHGSVGFHPESLLEWLGQLDSLFNERAYQLANPDVVTAIAQHAVVSGWDHYLRFGQREGRSHGMPAYSSGLAEFDAVAFDGSDAASLAPFLAGRLQPHHQLFISGFTPPTDWLPLDEGRTYLLGHTVYCPRPPATWLGPRQPTNGLTRTLPPVTAEEIYPEKPAQRADWPRISVITVSHNQGAGLGETLRSVLDQNYPNLEYIVIDGDSTDGLAEIIQPHAHRLVWRTGETVTSQAQGLNRGLALATGRILTWLNRGDRLAPGSLFTVGQTFLLHAADVVAGRCALTRDLTPAAHQLHRNHFPLDRIQPLAVEELLELDRGWLQRRFFQQPEVFFTRDIFERAGGRLREDLGSSMDYDLWVRLAKAGARLFALPEILAIASERPPPGDHPQQVSELRAVSAFHRPAV